MARRKITQKSDAAALPDLNERQEAFVQAVIAGLSASDAYRKAYDTTNHKPETIWAAASRLRNDVRVIEAVERAKIAGFGSVVPNLEEHCARLLHLSVRAENENNLGAAAAAEVSRGKAAGLYVEQTRDVSDHDPIKTLQEIAKHHPDLAAALAKQHNIPLAAATVSDQATRH